VRARIPGPRAPSAAVGAPATEVPTPGVPATDVPLEVPSAEVPTIGAPAPEVPTPEVPTPEVPTPGAPAAAARRTRRLRAWMLTLPVDVAALLAPLLWTVQYWKGTIFTAALTVVVFAAGGLYRARRHLSLLDELPALCGRLLACAAIVAIVAAERHGSVEYVGGFLRTIAVSAGLVIVGRAVSRKAVVVARCLRWVEHNAIVVGTGPVGTDLARLLQRYPQYGLRFAGFVDVRPGPSVGRLSDIGELIEAVDCDVIIVADVECPESELIELVRRPACSRCDVWVVPRLRDFHSHGAVPDYIGAIPVVRARRATLSGPKWAVKRTVDIVFSALGLVLLAPVLLACALATRVEGGPGIFFYQQRIGRHGKPFRLVKFRSMPRADEHESQTTWSVAGDPRVGPVGRFMRRTSLDELPQLWNILRGDMTFVGPRPERPYFVDQYSAEHPDYAMRHRVPVGLTGLAQVSGLRGDTPIADRARFDNYYIENWSLWLDVKVVLRTVWEVVRGAGG